MLDSYRRSNTTTEELGEMTKTNNPEEINIDSDESDDEQTVEEGTTSFIRFSLVVGTVSVVSLFDRIHFWDNSKICANMRSHWWFRFRFIKIRYLHASLASARDKISRVEDWCTRQISARGHQLKKRAK